MKQSLDSISGSAPTSIIINGATSMIQAQPPRPSAINKPKQKSRTYFSPDPLALIRPVAPATLMAAPDRLQIAATNYFNLQCTTIAPPTFEGLALAVGFTSFNQLRTNILNDNHPQPSRDILVMACAHLADLYQQNGLLETMNPSFIKYLLSAYLNITEKHELATTSDNTFTIRWEQPPPSSIDQANQAARIRTKEDLAKTATSTTLLSAELKELELEDLM